MQQIVLSSCIYRLDCGHYMRTRIECRINGHPSTRAQAGMCDAHVVLDTKNVQRDSARSTINDRTWNRVYFNDTEPRKSEPPRVP